MSWITVAVLVVAGACGESGGMPREEASSSAPGGGAGGKSPEAGKPRYLPLEVGATWTYEAWQGGVAQVWTTAITGREAAPGRPTVLAFRVETTASGGKRKLVSWQADPEAGQVVSQVRDEYPGDDAAVVRTSWEPYRIELDERPEKLKAGASWTSEYMAKVVPAAGPVLNEVRLETWTVLSIDETVTAGGVTYTGCLKVRRIDEGPTTGVVEDVAWYARGVGKVKAIEGGRVIELFQRTSAPPQPTTRNEPLTTP